jgi:hypothetical protein
MAVLAPLPVIEPVAVANVEALLAAIAPDRELDEPRENGREGRIERTGVDLLGSTGNDFGAAACPVAAGAVRVGSLEAPQDPSPVQKIVDQGIDRNQVHTDLQPLGANVSRADQDAGQRHRQHLVGNAVDVAQWLNQSHAHLRQRVCGALVVHLVEAVIDPADQVAFGNVANEQVQAVGNLIQVAVSQPMGWKRAGGDMVRLGAGSARLLVPAGMEMPIGFQLWAGWLLPAA